MYSRIFKPTGRQSFFLFGARGTGKTSLITKLFPKALVFDLLEAETFNVLLANPQRLDQLIPSGFNDWVVIDEVQKIPALLNEVHRLIEKRHLRFALTGSSARKLRAKGVNLLAGRALTYHLYPLTAHELGKDFSLRRALQWGHLPQAVTCKEQKRFLASYVSTYLKEEVQQEGLTRSLDAFARFLEATSFSQASVLNMTAVARECSVHRKVAEQYFSILEDLLIAYQIPVFSRRAKRKLVSHPKFFLFDVGVYRYLRPKGPLDVEGEIDGPALETLILQELISHNDYHGWDYKVHYWRTQTQEEVDFVLYGEHGFHALEVKRNTRVRQEDLKSLLVFGSDYPQAKLWLLYLGNKAYSEKNVHIVPLESFLENIAHNLG